MILKKENSIYIASTTWGWTDDTLIAAIFGFLPPDKETRLITGSESRILWSKTNLSNDTYYSAIDASVRLHKINDDLDFTVTNYGDIIIYRTIGCSYTPQEVIDSYNRYIGSRFFSREEDKEDKKEELKITIEANNYIYIASNTTGTSDDQLISALFGYRPACTKYENIHGCALLWSRTKFLHERSFVFNDAERRLHERDKKLDFVMTEKGDVIIYRDIISDKSKIFSAYYEYSKNDEPETLLRDANGRPIAGRYPYRVNANNTILPPSVIDSLSLNSGSAFWAARGNGKSVMTMKHMLNSIYGLNGGLHWDLWDTQFKLYFGVERATGKQKTVCLWKDGDKTIIRGDESVLRMPVQYAVAWCYVKRRFKTTSQFKKYVDNHSYIMDGITYFEGDARAKMAQASVNNRTKKYDIYDAAALAITAKHYGSVKTIMNYCDGWGE